MGEIILKAVNLSKHFQGRRGSLYSIIPEKVTIRAVDRVNLEVEKGHIVAIIGESGCGKSTLGCTLARIYVPTTGKIWFDGEEISKLQGSDLKRLRRKMQMVFQDPGSSLNPRHKIEDIISLPLKIHFNLSKNDLRKRVIELLDLVNLSQEMMVRYPPDLSGGEKQRVGIARALALNPKLVILDEPTSALDVSVQAKILRLLKNLQQDLHLTYLLITHNLSLAKNLADRVVVMYLGKVVEQSKTENIFKNPLHPYTKALLSAIPVVTEEEKKLVPKEVVLRGDLPSPADVPAYCSFFSRCQEKKSCCRELPEPSLVEIEKDHWVRCHLREKVTSREARY